MTQAGEALAAARKAYFQNDWAAQERYALEALHASQVDASVSERAMAFHHLGLALYHRNAADDARTAYLRAIELYKRAEDTASVAFAEVSLGSVELDLCGDAAAARQHYDAAIPVLRESDRAYPLGIALGNMAEALRLAGEYEAALRYAEEAVESFRKAGDHDHAGWQFITMANCYTLMRKYDGAFSSLRDAYTEITKNANTRWYAHYFDAWLMLAVNLAAWEPAAMLAGFLDRYRHEHRVPRLAGLAMWYKLNVQLIERNLQPDRMFELRMKGALFNVEQAQEAALRMVPRN